MASIRTRTGPRGTTRQEWTPMTLTDTAHAVDLGTCECEQHGFVAAPTVAQARALIVKSSLVCVRCRGIPAATRSDGWTLFGILFGHRP